MKKSKPAKKPAANKKKTKILLVYGGRSGEHDISLVSAASVYRRLDRALFEVIPVAIDLAGQWWSTCALIKKEFDDKSQFLPVPGVVRGGKRKLKAPRASLPVAPPAAGKSPELWVWEKATGSPKRVQFDVVFPVMHGPLCEDGALQGMFELADIAFVGCGVLASAVGMDKEVSKRLVRDAGLPIVPYVSVKIAQWETESAKVEGRIGRELGFPCFVKPVTLGSSVGVHKVKTPGELRAAMTDAFRYDVKVLVEKAIAAREVEFAVLESLNTGEKPLVSVPGEILPKHEFYSYEAKYVDQDGADLKLPAELTPKLRDRATDIARGAFLALECEGLARVDLFVDRGTSEVYFNEVNTMPGFTSISMYPKMMEASGVPYAELLTRLVRLAQARQARKSRLVREFHSG